LVFLQDWFLSMQVTETLNTGLKRGFTVVVPEPELTAKREKRLAELGRTMQMPGFRPGKVPMSLLKKRYGSSVMGEVLEKTVQDSSAKLLQDNEVRPALEPKIEVVSFDEGKDLEYTMAVETLPEIEPADLTGLTLERLVAPVEDKAIDEALERIANSNKQFEPVEEARAAENGDQLVIDFAGTVDGEPRPGMAGEDYPLELGAGNFIPGFEEQLVGIMPQEERTITVTFPADYHAADLAGKEAEFKVTAKELRAPVKVEIDDAFAEKLGLKDIETLKQTARDQIEAEYGRLTRLKLKRALMDALAERHDFEVPNGMVELEFDSIWKQVQPDPSRPAAQRDRQAQHHPGDSGRTQSRPDRRGQALSGAGAGSARGLSE
jgi:trigger factor